MVIQIIHCSLYSQLLFWNHLLDLDIWKNTPIMSFHVLSMILQYRIKKSKDVELPDCVKLMDEFQKKFRQHHDLAFVGDLYAITQHTMQVFSMKGVLPFSSVAADIMKLESLMSKFPFRKKKQQNFSINNNFILKWKVCFR